MAKVEIQDFSGLRPAASELRLGPNEATTAENVTLRRGLLAPRTRQLVWNSAVDPKLPIPDASTAATLFRFRRVSPAGDFWMFWTASVDVAPGPVANIGTTDQRHYYTGDGVPKLFTADSVDDSTPPYGGSPDTKYPYAWFNLGIAAPTAAATVSATAYSAPAVGDSGNITKLAVSTLTLRVDYWKKKKYIDNDSAGTVNIYAIDGIGAPLLALTPGTRVVVDTIVDANHVTVKAQTSDLLLKIAEADYGFAWGSTAGRLIWENHVKWNIYVPNGATLSIASHGLSVNDVLRITSTPTALKYNTTAVMTTSPHSTPSVGATRTLTPTSGAIEFTGSANFVIERDGTVVNPDESPIVVVDTTTRSYVHTWVSHLGEESAPSPATTPVLIEVGTSVGLSSFGTAPSSHTVIEKIRIYRASTGTEGTEFQFVADVSYSGGATYTDTLDDSALGELLPSETWLPPPAAMQGIVALPIGALAGFYDNVLCLSEPGHGHAWPDDYQYSLDYNIVALSPLQQSIIVLTTGNPYIVAGSHPRQMSPRRTSVRHPCMDKRSVTNSGDAVMYCAPAGLVRMSMNGAELLTEGHYTKETWTSVVGPEQATSRILRAWFFDDMYILHAQYTYNSVSYSTKLMFDFKTENLQITSFTEEIEAGFYDPPAGEFRYIPVSSDSGTMPRVVGSLPSNNQPVLRWDFLSLSTAPATEYTTGLWYSRTIPLQTPMCPAAARIVCRRLKVNGSYAAYGLVRMSVYGVRYGVWGTSSTVLVDETSLIANADVIVGTPGSGGWAGEHRSDPFRLPSTTNALFDALRIEVTVKGPVEVEEITIAESMEELQETP